MEWSVLKEMEMIVEVHIKTKIRLDLSRNCVEGFRGDLASEDRDERKIAKGTLWLMCCEAMGGRGDYLTIGKHNSQITKVDLDAGEREEQAALARENRKRLEGDLKAARALERRTQRMARGRAATRPR